jgi:exonuclease VII small subunit
MWKKDVTDTQPAPNWETYADAMNKFEQPARAFIEHVHLLAEARISYQKAMAVSSELRTRLDEGDRTLRSLMGQLERMVNNHLTEPSVDSRRPELVKGETVKERNERTGTEISLP